MSNNFNLSQTPNTPFSFRNKVINGNFDIWQRATSQTSSGYGSADRWILGNSGTTKTASRQSFTLGQTDVLNEPIFYIRHVVTSSAGASNFCNMAQRIEGVRTFAGKTVTVSFYAKADATKNIAFEFAQNFGTGGTPSAEVNGIGAQKISLTTSWTKFELTISIPSISGKSLGSSGNDFLAPTFWFDAGSTYASRTDTLGQQSGTFDIAQVQVEEGRTATVFEQRPVGLELLLCQRYYEIIWCGGLTGVTYTPNGDTRSSIQMKVQKFYGSAISVTYTGSLNVIAAGDTGTAINVNPGALSLVASSATHVRISLVGSPSVMSGCGAVASWGDNGSGNLTLYVAAEI